MELGRFGTLIQCGHCGSQLPTDASFCSSCGAALGGGPRSLMPPSHHIEKVAQVAADPLIGATVADRYHILSMIGRGGMGVVYKVEHSKIGKIMALKLLTGELARNKDTVRRFKREALMVSRLSHPNTVQVFDYGSANGLTYLAMEYLSGQDLGELVENSGPLPFPQVAKIVIQACGALREAHEHGIVHRDIKPENLFLTRSPSGEHQVKVLDFGLAKLQEGRDLQITRSGNIVGTPYYMPPEQVRGEEVDARGDVYSLCALLYTCITGVHLFEADNPVLVLTKQVKDAPVPPHERVPELHLEPRLSPLILKGLAKEPADRYQSVSELEAALQEELNRHSRSSLHLPDSGYFKTPQEDAASRDEVEQYERSLRRKGVIARALGVCAALGLAYGGVHLAMKANQPKAFSGREVEPNHEVENATRVPFGQQVQGHLGKRLTEERGDQDNFLFTVPKSADRARTSIGVRLTGLPNMSVCGFLFLRGSENPLFRLCGGRPGADLTVSQLSLRPGEYLFAVKQDLNAYAANTPSFIYENVSDDYTLHLFRAEESEEFEVEPNESLADKNVLDLSAHSELKGQLNFMRDVDTVCVQGAGSGKIVVSDAEGGSRPIAAALMVTPRGGENDKIPVRIHGGRSGFEISERDQPSPYIGPVLDLSEPACVELSLVPNPFGPRPQPVVAPASDHSWRLTVERSDSAEAEAENPTKTQ